jgi:uncharacterized protein YodC (DUF2158 family)
MTDEPLEVGEVVQLKSGGPAMTIQGIGRVTEGFECVWFEGTTPHMESYKKEVLKRWKEPQWSQVRTVRG